MSWGYSVLLGLISAIVGGVITFTVQYLLPVVLMDPLRERRELLRAFRKNAGPLMYASYQLFRRLRNILEEGNYRALADSWEQEPHWVMTHIYFVESTEYLFGVFFARLEHYYLQTLHLGHGREEISCSFYQKARRAQRTLYDVSLNKSKMPDHQVYLLEQKAMADALRSDGTDVGVMNFLEFKVRMARDKDFRELFSPIEKLIDKLRPDDGSFRFIRLQMFTQEARELYDFLAKHTHGDIYNIAERPRVTGDERERESV